MCWLPYVTMSSDREVGQTMQTLRERIVAKVQNPAFREYVTRLLVEICRIDTSPFPDVSRMRDAEERVFSIIERELASLSFSGARSERRPIDPRIAAHPAFSQLHFTKTEERPEGLTPEETYAGRANLLYFVPGSETVPGNGPSGVAVNAHIDVVKPFIPPRIGDGIVYGRGSCDDKGAVVTIVAALKVLSEVLSEAGEKLPGGLLGMFVIEEETGGNGSLSLAVDRPLKEYYDRILVLECAGNGVFPANRGAVWYRADLTCPSGNVFEMSAFVIEQLEQEGRAIRAESRHPLFPQRPVQTCHGMLGHYGEHPSRICGEVSFAIETTGVISASFRQLVEDVIESALAEYTAVYGDKTRVIDPQTGLPKVDHHYDLVSDGNRLVCHVHGSTGHMGAILENDGAITKMAGFVRALCRSREKFACAAGGKVSFRLFEEDEAAVLKLEGGQGFVPTHDIAEIMDRVRKAAETGAARYLHMAGLPRDIPAVKVTYDKLHNAAFDGDPGSVTMQNAIAAARGAGIWDDAQDIMGWTVSCDSRLFAAEYPGMPVITSGAGHLTHAHSDQEQIRIDELCASVVFVALFLLLETAAASGPHEV